MEAFPLLLVLTLITSVLLCLSQLLLRFLAIILTAAASNYWVLIPAFLVMAVFLFFRWYYLKTSREIKRLEAIGRFQVPGQGKKSTHQPPSRPLPDFISQPWENWCEIKSGSGLGTRLERSCVGCRLFMCGKPVFGRFLTIFSLTPTLSAPSSS